ncbi:DEAD/DEAH box helicase [Microbulbifer sp. CAU 1566]|uniref:DEAD/DEAH box helicase n=1 Tax=Microbulbifer sp. CAU 1566 TaxID=2933269 RepID=UPI002005E88F|nr:DEAD/DEAH box helicase [Microbulbifer sp. CAU 1566]MCK7596481.1 DEAD/DEAH box helicase [Microbulbifer sp. CAU 1566]
MTFRPLGLSAPILQALEEKGYSTPTEIQRKAIPAILEGRDVIATAQTGTGKTAAFVLPILDMLSGKRERRPKRFRALILVPTRELAMQVEDNVRQYGKHLAVTSMAMVGGVDLEPQKQQLIEGVDIVVATPGRLLDLARQRALHFDELEVLVLDEADRMLDMGFIDDLEKIIARLPTRRQSLLFSATMSRQVRSLADIVVEFPFEVSVAGNKKTAPKISQWLIAVDKHNKSALLSHLVTERNWTQALIFIRTQHGAAKLVSQLEKRGIKAEAIHGGKSQASRSKILADFKSGEINILIATGVAARGIDIDELERVVNYDLPDDVDEYIHRIGRTGRAGSSGEAVSLVSKDDFKRLCAVERRLGKIIERVTIDEFPVVKDLPASNLNFSAKRGAAKKTVKKAGRPEKPTSPATGSPSGSPPRKTPWGSIKK